MEFFVLESFLGSILILSKKGVPFRVCLMEGERDSVVEFVKQNYPLAYESYNNLRKVISFFEKYLSGHNVLFTSTFDVSSLSNFKKSVLLKVKEIPYGNLRSYEWVAKGMGRPFAQRAVGQALKTNPLPIIIPCHRVIRKNGDIGGFSLGIGVKIKLLGIEGIDF